MTPFFEFLWAQEARTNSFSVLTCPHFVTGRESELAELVQRDFVSLLHMIANGFSGVSLKIVIEILL